MSRYEIFTDGSCRGNPGPGGWGVVVLELDGDAVISRRALTGRADGNTTNMRMEMTAVYEGIRSLGATGSPITILTDSEIIVKGMTQWLPGWKDNGWRKADRKPVLNLDLWMGLDAVAPKGRVVHWRWTKGHAGHELNEAADMLATNAADGVYGDPVGSLINFHPELFSEVAA